MDIPQTEMHISWLIEVWLWLLICLTLMYDGEEVCDGLYITSHNLRLLIQGDTHMDVDRDKFFLWFYLCEGERYGEAKKKKTKGVTLCVSHCETTPAAVNGDRVLTTVEQQH